MSRRCMFTVRPVIRDIEDIENPGAKKRSVLLLPIRISGLP